MKTYPRVPDREGWWVWDNEIIPVALWAGDLVVLRRGHVQRVEVMLGLWRGPAYRRTEDGEFVAMVEGKL